MSLEIPYSDLNLRSLLADGHQKLQAERATRAETTRGLLRAGSAGCVGEGGVYGECHRVAHLRWLGVEKPVEPTRSLMFQAGEGNEDLWERVLVPSWQGQVLRGQEVKKQGSWGTVMGSPDIVLANPEGVWRVVLELKLICATNSAIRRELEGEPDSKHLVQSATYMWLTGLPCVLCYTNRSDFAVEFQRKKYGGLAKVGPYYRLFYLSFKGDQLFYRDEWNSTEVPTHVTGAGVQAYYQRLAQMAEEQQLYDRPSSDHVNGAAASWNKCDPRYCVFSDTCDRYERDYLTWVHAARAVTQD